MLSQYDAPACVASAVQAGAQGYVVKARSAEEIIGAIRTVLAGGICLTRALAARLVPEFVGPSAQSARPGFNTLSRRELQVLRLLGSGLSTREVAEVLKLSVKTIETYREHLKLKLGLAEAPQLIRYARDWAREQVSVPPGALLAGSGSGS